MVGKLKDDLTNMEFDNWSVVSYEGKSKYKCKCKLCGREKTVDGYFLKNNKAPKCECITNKSNKGRIDLKGKTFGYWEVLEYAGDKKWKCKCHCGCGTVRDVAGSDLRNGKSTGCGAKSNRNLDNLKGKTFGDWLVLEKGPTGEYGETQWICECQCEAKTKRIVKASALKSGSSTSCGHSTTGFKDLTGKTFGNWKVLERCKVQFSSNSTDWVCECQCENKTLRILSSVILRNGVSKSCGCLTNELRKQTTQAKYGVDFTSQIGTERTEEQLNALKSKDNMIKFIRSKFDYKPTITQVAEELNIHRATFREHMINMGIQDMIELNTQTVSGYERALNYMFPCTHLSDRSILNGKEIDLYYPDKKFGIEFNGNYFHSEIKRDMKYHQEKSIEAAKKGVFIFHIFEYEWNNRRTRELLKQLISRYLYGDKLIKIYARNCSIKHIDNSEADEFISKYHLQGKSTAEINLGCYYNNKLIGVMAFGKPRFNRNYQYELVRLCWHPKVAVIGGSKKLFNKFVTDYKPLSIISYCDISKFKGNVYTELGFKLDGISSPNYKWVNLDNSEVIPRYKTQKHTLVEKGLGTEDQTEVEIMHNLGYVRVFDCGNLRLTWYAQGEE